MKTEMYCIDCGYDLKRLASQSCPECGRAFDPAKRETYLWFYGKEIPLEIWCVPVLQGLILLSFGAAIVFSMVPNYFDSEHSVFFMMMLVFPALAMQLITLVYGSCMAAMETKLIVKSQQTKFLLLTLCPVATLSLLGLGVFLLILI